MPKKDLGRREAAVGVSVVAVGAAIVLAAAFGFHASPAASQPLVAKPTIITVSAGKPSEFKFKLSKVSLIPAGKITFKFTNLGVIGHDFKICTKAVTSAKANTCVGKGTPTLKKGGKATLTVTLKKGQYQFLCAVPGHAGAGMKGLIGVGVKVKAATTPATTPTTTTPPPTTTPTTPTGPETLQGDPAAGKAVFAANSCGSCHTLAAAGANGNVGPNLDASKPSQAKVRQFVQNGSTSGGTTMPAFSNMSQTDLNNIGAFVYASTH